MPRPIRGTIDVHTHKDGVRTYYVRMTVDGRRERERLGTDREGWTPGRALVALEERLEAVRAGTWKRPQEQRVGDDDPTFRLFASSWLEDNMLEWRPSTIRDIKWRLESHLLPHVGEDRLSTFDIPCVTAVKTTLLKESRRIAERLEAGVVERDAHNMPLRPLSNESINKCMALLSRILDDAVERGYLRDNPSRRVRRLRHHRPRRPVLEPHEVRAMFEAADRLDLDEDFSRLALGTNVPTLEDLGSIRRQRDDEWQELRDYLDGRVVTPASPDIFEGHLRHADDVADRLRIEAESVARLAELTVRKRRLDAEVVLLDQGKQQLGDSRAEHDERWATAWEPAATIPGSPHEMKDWLRRRQSILERADCAARAARSVEAERRTRDEHMQTLRVLLAATGHDTTAIATLSGLLAMAQTQVSEAQTIRDGHYELTRDLRLARAAAAKNRDKAEEHRTAMERWNEAWTGIIAENGWPDDVGADSARQVLAAVTELADHLHEIEQLTTRVDGIRERLNAFDDDAAALIEEVAPELASWPVHDAVAELERRVSDAIRARVSRATLEGEVDAARNELESANRSVEAACRELATLLTLADVATIDELPEAERRSARAADLHDQLPELERQITDTGHAPLHELIERADAVDLDALDAQSAEGEDEIARLEEQLRELDVRIGELGGEQRKMERLQGAAGAAEHVEQRVAELRELAERYVRLHLAAWALSEAIDAYRRAHKTPVLERADELFAQLTCGWFQGLEVTFDEADDPALVGVRRTGEKVPVKLMSTGTREQLYLSLRLASLERHVELRGPMPVILDDVVLHSDPQRKTAILRALADLGERTQVITFTHDPQVVALAQHAIDPDRLTVHELGGNEITGALQPAIAAGAVRAIRPARAA